MRVYLTLGRDGRILVQARADQGNVLGDLLKYVSQGEQFMGVAFEQLSQSTPGAFDIPDQPDVSGVSPDTSELPPEEPQEQPQEGPQG